MEVRPDILKNLLCSVCGEYLSCVPIKMMMNGSVLCGRCKSPNDEPTVRITPYEQLAEMMLFPCREKSHGCPETFYVAELEDHEDDCIYQQHKCPVSDPGVCDWSGSRKDILNHCREQHAGSLLQESCTIQHDISNTNHKNFLMTFFNMLFIIRCEVCTVSKNISHSVELIGKSALANKYKYEVEIWNNRKKLISGGDVAPLGCKTLEEDFLVRDNTDKILNVLGDIKDIIVKIHIGRNCIKCNTFIFKYWQPTNNGWCCQDCAPTRRLCKYSSNGCTYMDIDKKIEKHEQFFCQFGTRCSICNKVVVLYRRSKHYMNDHPIGTHKAGTTWWTRIQDVNVWRCVFIYSEVGTLFCRFRLTDTEFILGVWASLRTEQLSNYRCIVQLTNPTTKFTIRKKPKLDYDNEWDLRVFIAKDEFQMYVSNNDVNIKIEILKIETCC